MDAPFYIYIQPVEYGNLFLVLLLQNYFLLSSSMDKTVRLWHISRRECLCTFQHVDFVTAIVFHPKVSTISFGVVFQCYVLCTVSVICVMKRFCYWCNVSTHTNMCMAHTNMCIAHTNMCIEHANMWL